MPENAFYACVPGPSDSTQPGSLGPHQPIPSLTGKKGRWHAPYRKRKARTRHHRTRTRPLQEETGRTRPLQEEDTPPPEEAHESSAPLT